MNWVEIQKSFHIGQIVNAHIDHIDPAGLFSTVDSVARGYTKRTESQLSRKTIDLHQKFVVGQNINAKIIGFNTKHQTIELSFKDAAEDPWPDYSKNIKIGDFIEGQVVLLTESKAIVEIIPGVAGIIHKNEAWIQADNIDNIFMVDDRVRLEVIGVDNEHKLFILSAKGLFKEEKEQYDTQATFRIEEKLTEALQVYRWEQTRQVCGKYSISPLFKTSFKHIYIIDRDDANAIPMINMLSSHDLDASFVEPAKIKDISDKSAIALVACTFDASHFLPSKLATSYPNMPLLVYGTAEEFTACQKQLQHLDVSYIKVPHSSQDLIKTLNIIADGEKVNAVPYSLSHSSPVKLEDETIHRKRDIHALLAEIQQLTNAGFVIIFQINLNSMDTDIYASTGKEIKLSTFDHGHLQFTPISDVIIDGNFVIEDHGGYHFKYMKPIGTFESLAGIRINFSDEYGYGLFLFSTHQYAFSTVDIKLFSFCEIAVRSHIEREKLLEQTSREQKFVLSGKLSANFMHEIKNQIQAMDYWLDVLKTDSIALNSGELKAHDKLFCARYDQAIHGALMSQKQTRSIEDLFLNLLRTGDKRTLAMEKYLDDFINTISPIAKKRKIKLDYFCQQGLEIKVNLSSFNQILLNMILNCLDFVPAVRKHSGHVHIKAFKVKDDKLPFKLEISDNGPGINERHREHIFELLYTTKKNGSGLGLAISRRLAKEMQGRIYVKETTRLSGATFLFELPLQ